MVYMYAFIVLVKVRVIELSYINIFAYPCQLRVELSAPLLCLPLPGKKHT